MRAGGLDKLPFRLQASTSETTTCNALINLRDNESVTVCPFITVHTLRKKGEIQIVSVLTRLPSSLVP